MKYSYDRTATSINDMAFNRMADSLEDHAKAMKAQVKRLGGIEAALQQGHGQTLQGQLNEMASALRVLQRRLGG